MSLGQFVFLSLFKKNVTKKIKEKDKKKQIKIRIIYGITLVVAVDWKKCMRHSDYLKCKLKKLHFYHIILNIRLSYLIFNHRKVHW